MLKDNIQSELFVELSNKQQQFVAGGYGGYGDYGGHGGYGPLIYGLPDIYNPPNNPHGYGGYPWPLWWLLTKPVNEILAKLLNALPSLSPEKKIDSLLSETFGPKA